MQDLDDIFAEMEEETNPKKVTNKTAKKVKKQTTSKQASKHTKSTESSFSGREYGVASSIDSLFEASEDEEETGDVENFIPETSEIDEIFNAESEEDTSNLSATVLGDILSGVNGGAYDYTFNEVADEELEDGSSIGYQGTVINKSHVKTSLNKSGAVGVRAETKESKALRESYIAGHKEDGTPYYNFNAGGKVLDLESLMKSKEEVVLKQNTKHMGTLYFKECTKEEARDMIICGHYSHKFQGYFGKVNVGVYTEGRLVGVASFGGLMNPKSYKNFGDFNENEILELNRLWVDDELGMNTETMLLSASWTIMRKKYPEIKIVQSFADGRLGAGTIYKATGFKYFGCETTLFFQDKETGVIYHKVGIENTKAPISFIRLNKLYLEGRLQQFRVNTYRYIYPLYTKIDKPVFEKGEPVYKDVKRVKYDENGNPMKDENGNLVLVTEKVQRTQKVPLVIAMQEHRKVKIVAKYKDVTEEEIVRLKSDTKNTVEITGEGMEQVVTVTYYQKYESEEITKDLQRKLKRTLGNENRTLISVKTQSVADYPEYQRGQNMLMDYEHPINLIARSYLYSRMYEYTDENRLDYSMFFEYHLNKREGRHELDYQGYCKLSEDERISMRKGTKWYNEIKKAARNNTLDKMADELKDLGDDLVTKRLQKITDEFKIEEASVKKLASHKQDSLSARMSFL